MSNETAVTTHTAASNETAVSVDAVAEQYNRSVDMVLGLILFAMALFGLVSLNTGVGGLDLDFPDHSTKFKFINVLHFCRVFIFCFNKPVLYLSYCKVALKNFTSQVVW